MKGQQAGQRACKRKGSTVKRKPTSEVDAALQRHLARVDAQDRDTCFGARRGELDLSVDSSRSEEGRVENVDSVRCHDDLKWRVSGDTEIDRSACELDRKRVSDAALTLMFFVGSNPSSWFSSSSIVLWTSESPPPDPLSPLLEPIESISSMKMMLGACSLAMTKSSRTMREPSPMYFCTSSDPETRMNLQSVWCATARARSVLPVPGGPYSRTPFGCAMPSASNSSGCLTAAVHARSCQATRGDE